MRKTDLQAAAVSLLLHASLLGGFAAMTVKYEAPPKPPIKEVLIDIQMGAQDIADDQTDEATEAMRGEAKQGNGAVEPANEPAETIPAPKPIQPKSLTKPEPRVDRTPPKPEPPSKPVKAPTVRPRIESPTRVVTPRTKTVRPNVPQRNRAESRAEPTTPRTSAPVSRPTATPRPVTPTPRPTATERPTTTAPRPTTTATDRNGDGRPDARPNGAGTGAGGDSDRNSGGRNSGGGGSGGSARSAGTGATVLGLNRRVVRRVTPRHSELVNSVIDVCVTVNPAGAVISKSICKKGNPSLESSSLAAVSGWRFNALPPGVEGNQSGRIRFRFVIE